MLDFSTKHNIVPDIEVIRIEEANSAWKTMKEGKMSHRYVIDIYNSFK